MSIKEKGMLVSVSVSVWLNTASDSSVVKDISTQTHTKQDVHKYAKVLVPPSALELVHAARTALRNHWWQHTLPWGNSGVRLLPADRYQTFIETLRTLRGDFDREVKAFSKIYPVLQKDAITRLGTLYREQDFPKHIETKFGVRVDIAPIPDVQDFRITLSESERKELEKEVTASLRNNAMGAMQSLVEKLNKTVELLAVRMREKDRTLRDSLVQNVKEACEEMDAFNTSLFGDSKLRTLSKAAASLTQGVDMGALREDDKLRKQVADKADDVLAKMASYIGGGAK